MKREVLNPAALAAATAAGLFLAGATGASPVYARGGGNAPPTPALSPAPGGLADPDYRLDSEDTLTVVVARHTDVSGSFKIPPDGLLRLPRLLTPVPARGKTLSELASDITGRLVTEGKLVLRPGQVTVTVSEARRRRVYVTGNAVRGGEFEMKNGWRVSDLVAVMGGIPQPDRVRARVTNPRRETTTPVDLKAALADLTSPANLSLQEGDTLTVEAPPRKRLLITGEGPRGEKEFEEWMGLKRALLSMGYGASNHGTGDLTRARLIRHENPQDPSSPTTETTVDLFKLLTDETAPEVPFRDMDTLDFPVSDKYVMVLGAVGTPRKWYLPLDRKTYLTDVFTSTGDAGGRAAIGRIRIYRPDEKAKGGFSHKDYDLGKFMSKADLSQNPEVHPRDMIYVPTNNKTDYIGNVWTAFGLYNLMQTFLPGIRPR